MAGDFREFPDKSSGASGAMHASCMAIMNGVVCYAHIAMQHACMSCAKQRPVSLQVMSLVAITTVALGPTVFAPAAGKRIMPPEVSICDSMLSPAYTKTF